MKIYSPSFERTDERGLFQEVLNEGTWGTLNFARMKKDAVVGNHYHEHTDLFLFITSGSAEVVIEHVETKKKEKAMIKAGQGVWFHPFESHAVRFLEDAQFLMLKSSYDPKNRDTIEHPVL